MANADEPATPVDVTDDPAAPVDASLEASAANLANFGTEAGGEITADAEIESAAPGAGFTIAFAINKALAFLQECEAAQPRVTYGLGKKIKPGQVPGRDFTQVDCSGFVREIMRQATNLGTSFPDGSVVQHDWVRSKGFTRTSVSAGSLKDGVVRIAFLSPNATSSGIGHVVLLHGGVTIESHGGVGPDSRPWIQTGWQAKTTVYVLTG